MWVSSHAEYSIIGCMWCTYGSIAVYAGSIVLLVVCRVSVGI